MYTLFLTFVLLCKSLFPLASADLDDFNPGYGHPSAYSPRAALTSTVVQQQLGPRLSRAATLSFPNSADFKNLTTRWSILTEPDIAVVVEVAEPQDVAATIKFANQFHLPFLATSGGHGSTSTLHNLQHGISIYLRRLNHVKVAPDGKTARIGGGIIVHHLVEELAAHGKTTATTMAGCPGFLSPALGGGFGRYMGHFGLILDNIIDMTVVLADGSIVAVSKDSHSDLYWGMLGAGQNFGIVVEATFKLYDPPTDHWFFAEMQFTQDKLEAYFETKIGIVGNGTQPKELASVYTTFFLNPEISATDPVIELQFNYAGSEAEAAPYLRPFLSLNPTTFKKNASIHYSQTFAAAGQDIGQPLCYEGFESIILVPLGLQVYNTTANRAVYNLFKDFINENPAFNGSFVQFESYAVEGMKSVDPASTAYPHRDDNILVAFDPVYPFNPAHDSLAYEIANKARDIWHAGDAPWRKRTAYLNYAAGDETVEQLYGHESWRLEKLRALKKKYDPKGKFGFYNPIR